MAEREAEYLILVGVNGTGKSTVLVDFIHGNERNLVLPSNRADKAWFDVPELNAGPVTYVPDPENPRNQIPVADVPDMRTFIGTRVFHMDAAPRARFGAVVDGMRGFVNGGLVLDDFRGYIPSKSTLPAFVTNMFKDRRHRMLDIAMACHSFQDINSQLMSWGPKFLVFRTTLPPNDNVLDKVHNPDALLACIARVNERAKSRPHYHELFLPE